jgi:23S rRNA (guanosine2251-2'-O)-methyltransferase
MKKRTKISDFNKAIRGGGKAKPQSQTKSRGSGGTAGSSHRSQGRVQGATEVSQAKGGHVSIPKNWRVISGTHAINECLRVRPSSVAEIWLKKGWQSSQDLAEIEEFCRSKKVKIVEKDAALIDRINAGNQGALGFSTSTPELDLEQILAQESATIVFLDGIEDPHNLGAILRTSWLMGVDGIVIPEDRAVGLTPAVHKVACGGVEHVPVLATTSFSRIIEQLKEAGFWVYGLAAGGQNTLFDLKLSQKVAWVVGAEDKGMRKPTEKLCDELTSIPQVAEGASYNASVAAAIALSETYRQRKLNS